MDFQPSLSIFFITTTLDLWVLTRTEFFTAIADIDPLLNSYKRVIDNLDDYMANEGKRLAGLRKNLNRYKKEYILATKNISNYLENPINTFTLMKRLTVDLEFIQKNMLTSSDYIKNITTNITSVIYPTLEDLTGAIQALIRLQQTYRLDIGELAEGRLIGTNPRDSQDPGTSTPMTASDCFEFGWSLFEEENYHKALLWLMESLRKLSDGDELFYISKVNVLEYISFTHYQLGDNKTAIEWLKKLLAIDPEHERGLVNLEILQETYEEDKLKVEPPKETSEDGQDNDTGNEQLEAAIYVENYYAMCRGDFEIPNEMQKRLKCSYLTKNHPFLKLAPIKMEQIYIEPDVFLFHEVMSDEEIEHIKDFAKPKIVRSEVFDPVTGNGITAFYRISKTAWLSDDESEVTARVTRRAADFTGFDVDFAEHLQVANYGIGGHYDPHVDYEEKFIPGDGNRNRIATVLFYMSDVPQGGATVFIELGLTVFPIKKSALFWTNLFPSGEGNEATLHAACPVLRGSKWASNLWIHDIGQELVKPCSLEV